MRCNNKTAAFTLMELLISLGLMAVIIPVIYEALTVATLAGEVSQRKAHAVRIAERVLNESILNGQARSDRSGTEKSGPFDFTWTLKDEPWTQLGGLSVSTQPNGVNQTGVNSTVLHQLSVDVTYPAKGRNFDVHVSTVVNISTQ